MPAFLTGALWATLVAYLLWRLVRQGRAFNAAELSPPCQCPISHDVTIVIPMRDELPNIDACLESMLGQRDLRGRWEVVVVDDNSTDGTAQRLQELSASEPRLRVICSGLLPPGWTGKSHACWLGAKASRSEWLCFVDADLRGAPMLVASAIATASDMEIDMLSLSPFQELGSFWERLIVPAGLLTIAGALDLNRIDNPDMPDVTANGQFLLFRRDVYEAVGGHWAVRGEICEDKALARLVKRQAARFRLLSGERLARTRMYRDLGALWNGLAKNAVEILGSGPASVAAATAAAALAWATVLLPVWNGVGAAADPYALDLVGFMFCLLASMMLIGVHVRTLRHCGVPAGYSLLFPVAYVAVAALAWFSLALRWTGRVRWKGRTYRVPGKSSPRRR
jgi:chlorobactene glucosyltransferase